MYKGKTFDLWEVENNNNLIINLLLHYNSTIVTFNIKKFIKLKKEILKLNKNNDYKGEVIKINYDKKQVTLNFLINNLELKLPIKEFEHFKNEIKKVDIHKIQEGSNLYEDDFFESYQLFETIIPKKSFEDVILNDNIKRRISMMLTQIKNHNLIFNKWGLGKKHYHGKSISLNFVGVPGTGKTLVAEAIAKKLGKKLLVVQYSNLIDSYVGETGKNIKAVFDYAKKNKAILLFDEADSIISTRTNVDSSTDSLVNMDKNILLKELENFEGIVIFATNLASNIDKAFERRISSHILFDIPNIEQREKIFKILIDKKTPIAKNVKFSILAKKYKFSGGDIQKAVLNAARLAVKDKSNEISMEHFLESCELVKEGKTIMDQSLDEDKSNVNYIG